MALPPGNEFDYARKRAAQQEASNLQQQRDALARRQAQTGGGVRGALIKQEQVASDNSAQRLAQANEGIDSAQRAEERRIREIDEGRQFARGEREASQSFSRGEREASQAYGADQAAIQRRFQTGEREGSQGFAAGESALARRFAEQQQLSQQKFQTGERLGSQDFTSAQALKQQQFLTGERMGSQDFAKAQQKAQFGQQKMLADLAQQGERERLQKQIVAQQYAQKQEFAQQNAMAEFAAEKQKYAQEVANAYDWQKVQTQLGFAREQFEHEKQVDEFNKDMANRMADQKGPLEQLFGGFGNFNVFNKDSGINREFYGRVGRANPMNPESYFGGF